MPTTPDFHWGSRTYVIGVLNATPDSFSGDGLGTKLEAAVRRAAEMVAAGVDVLDVGGESTRPGAAEVSLEKELERVVPLVEAVARRLEVPISVDTSKAEVARQSLTAGAAMINDVWALQRDPAMAAVVAQAGAWLILMHNRQAAASVDELGGHYAAVDYDDVVDEVRAGLVAAAGRAQAAGVRRERLIVDPGLGFGKTHAQNLELIRRLPELRSLGWPILVGVSRKSFTGRGLKLPVDRRLETSLAAMTVCIVGGADLVRVHDVPESIRAARMADEIVRAAPA